MKFPSQRRSGTANRSNEILGRSAPPPTRRVTQRAETCRETDEKLRILLEQSESAVLEQQKDAEKLRRAIEDGKNEVRNLERKIANLEKELECKAELENKIAQLKGFIRFMKNLGEEELKDAVNKKNKIEEDLKEKVFDLDQLYDDYQTVITKDRKSNDELQEVRDALLKGLVGRPNTEIGIKRMGELEFEPFQALTRKRSRRSQGVDVEAAILHSSWESHIRNPEWHPFKIINYDHGVVEEIIDEDDKMLKSVKKDLGVRAYDAIKSALIEMNEYNSSGRYVVPELWNFKENRKARLVEVIEHILKMVINTDA